MFKGTSTDPVNFVGHIDDIEGVPSNIKSFAFEFVYAEDAATFNLLDDNVEIATIQEINSETAQAFGYFSIQLQPGFYTYDNSLGEKGGFRVQVVVE